MSLPILNSPKYDLLLPSGLKIRFRPFTVKEQKVLLTVADSIKNEFAKSEKPVNAQENLIQVIKLLDELLSGCIEKYDSRRITLPDLEWAFVNIRARSIGEVITIKQKCQTEKCEGESLVALDIEKDFTIHSSPEHKNTIKLNDEYDIELKGFTVSDLLDPLILSSFVDKKGLDIRVLKFIIRGVWKNGEEFIPMEGHSDAEQAAFIESLPLEATKKIGDFLQTQPKVKCQKVWKCSKCEKENVVSAEGILSFF